jgi:hypothetical protein
MTEDQYIRLVIAKHRVKSNTAARTLLTAAQQLCRSIRKWADPYLTGIQCTGSYAKGTNIVGTTDLDLLISLRPMTPFSVQQIYERLATYLKARGYSIRKQNVSIGVNYKNVSIDLVPGRKQPGSTYDHTLWRRKARKWTKTNVHRHVLLVKQSGRLDEIRAIKIWRKLHSLEFPSFYLELSVIKALMGRTRFRIASNLSTVFEYLAHDFVNATILDPSNSNNKISDELTDEEKQVIAHAAHLALLEPYWSNVIW